MGSDSIYVIYQLCGDYDLTIVRIPIHQLIECHKGDGWLQFLIEFVPSREQLSISPQSR